MALKYTGLKICCWNHCQHRHNQQSHAMNGVSTWQVSTNVCRPGNRPGIYDEEQKNITLFNIYSWAMSPDNTIAVDISQRRMHLLPSWTGWQGTGFGRYKPRCRRKDDTNWIGEAGEIQVYTQSETFIIHWSWKNISTLLLEHKLKENRTYSFIKTPKYVGASSMSGEQGT